MRALIFGATGELGRVVAGQLAEDGYSLSVHGRLNVQILRELVSTLPSTTSYQGDVNNEDGVRSVVRDSAQDGDLEVLVYCAGVNLLAKPIAETSTADWQETLDTNLTGAFFAVREAIPFLRETNGRIVIVSSIFGIESPVNRGSYSVSKHGLAGLVQSVAREEGQFLTINGVCPGPMWTENVRKIFVRHAMEEGISSEEYAKERLSTIPAGRFGTLQECANVISFLVSPRASFINGELVRITGGSPT